MEEEKSYRSHVLVIPFHGQGHINPMLQFAKRLAFHGLKVTIPTVLSNTRSIKTGFPSITLESIYDDETQGGFVGPGGFQGFIDRFQASATKNIYQLIKKLENSPNPIKCVIYDNGLPWALDIAKELGILGAIFFISSAAAVSNYYNMYLEYYGDGEDNKTQPKLKPFSKPGMPELRVPNLASMGSNSDGPPPIIRHTLKQFSNIHLADWVLFNSFDHMEEEVLKWMSKIWPVRAVGPLLPSIYLDKRIEGDVDYTYNLYNPEVETSINWLNKKEAGSVVYVSFGSVAALNEQQMAEMAIALKKTSINFLWVVKKSEERNLPADFSSEKGLVVNWCSQLKVLAHPAIGCFVTHCGASSALESMVFGVPMVAMPQFLDHFPNSFFVDQVFGTGVRPKSDPNNLVIAEEIQKCIEQVMEKKTREAMMPNVLKWKELAKAAMDEGGSSDTHINEFVAALVSN